MTMNVVFEIFFMKLAIDSLHYRYMSNFERTEFLIAIESLNDKDARDFQIVKLLAKQRELLGF